MERRRQIFFGVIIALVVGFSVIYYFWGSIINRGTLLIYMEPPFTADFYERKEVVECTQSPCKIVQPMGVKSFFISKEGYETFFTSEEIKLWRTVERKIDMKMNPHFAKVEEAPVEASFKYDFAVDPSNQMQKLFNSDNADQKAIIYFPNALTSPAAFGDDKMILVIDRADSSAVYKVNAKEKSKQQLGNIPQFKNIISGKWSNDGKFFVASMLRQQNLWIMNESGVIEQTNLKSDINLATWRKEHEMILVTGSMATLYDPIAKTQESITLDKSFSEDPSKIISVNKGENLYVQAGEFFYQLILE
ncbi:MAG: hypothetical protein WCX95_05400 [Candidatus Gracilibacteria bacterium]